MCWNFYFYLHLDPISQTLTYSFDVLHRKIQVLGMWDSSIKYNGGIHSLMSIICSEGVVGLYCGLWPNLCEFLFSFSVFAELMMHACMQSRLPLVYWRHSSHMSWCVSLFARNIFLSYWQMTFYSSHWRSSWSHHKWKQTGMWPLSRMTHRWKRKKGRMQLFLDLNPWTFVLKPMNFLIL